ncbi:LysE/ArgO family amino acid transporter [Caulobacter mirabilis]|uniref:Amino acid transporter n=1 Tax=Caulobacter mirabilis TaxID=69666 RepID=A0A2D2ATB7_9CAUL|nr:LysE/ArgO family amino acid transporter [Caulobacter mirabilis]ATQ41262.1 amino acid transporter [Caulobacter mirabilis]
MSLLPVFFKGFALAAALIMAIGAQNMFVLRQGLRREHVGAIVLFCATADALLITAGVLGLGALLSLVPNLALTLTLGGAAFLTWYGLSAFRRALGSGAMVLATQPTVSLGRALAGTAGFTFLNPHVYLDTVVLMGTVGSAQPASAQPVFILGAAAASLSWFAALGYGARFLAPVFTKPKAWKVLDLFVGVTMFCLAGGLVLKAMSLL